MRGARHSDQTKEAIGETKREQYRRGEVKIVKYKISKIEREIGEELRKRGFEVKAQHHVEGVPFLYDFLVGSDLLIEVQGDYRHANPKKYTSGTMLKMQSRGFVLVNEIWRRDEEKRAAAEAAGFRVVYVWESDYKARGFAAVASVIGG